MYEDIPTGAFGAIVIKSAVERAKKTRNNQDTVEMVRSYEQLKGCK